MSKRPRSESGIPRAGKKLRNGSMKRILKETRRFAQLFGWQQPVPAPALTLNEKSWWKNLVPEDRRKLVDLVSQAYAHYGKEFGVDVQEDLKEKFGLTDWQVNVLPTVLNLHPTPDFDYESLQPTSVPAPPPPVPAPAPVATVDPHLVWFQSLTPQERQSMIDFVSESYQHYGNQYGEDFKQDLKTQFGLSDERVKSVLSVLCGIPPAQPIAHPFPMQNNSNNIDGLRVVANPSNARLFHAYITGPNATAYENGIFRVDIFVPQDYPIAPPKAMFMTKIWHPNIDKHGRICLDILKDKWSPALQIIKVCQSLQVLLQDPNAEDPLNNEAAEQFTNNQGAFFQKASTWTTQFAQVQPPQ